MTDYVEFALSKLSPWIAGYYGTAWAEVHGTIANAISRGATDAIGARHIARRTVDALPLASLDRMIDRATDETDAQLRARLLAAWDSWAGAGTVDGLVAALAASGFAAQVIEGYGGEWWSFRVEITAYPPGTLLTPVTDVQQWGAPGLTWGGVSPYAADLIRNTIRRYKSAHSKCTSIVIYGPDAWFWGWSYVTWGSASWGGTEYIIDPIG